MHDTEYKYINYILMYIFMSVHTHIYVVINIKHRKEKILKNMNKYE